MGRRAQFAASVSLVAAVVGVSIGTAAPVGETVRAGETAATPNSATSPAAPKLEPQTIRLDGVVLVSTASAEVTRRTADHLRGRLKQYRQFLPPRAELKTKDRAEIKIKLYGTSAAYRAAVAMYGLHVENPACYLWEPSLIFLGFDGAKYDDVLAAAEARSADLERKRVEAARRFADTKKEEAQRFQRDNVAAQVRHDISYRSQQEFNRAKAAAKQQQDEADEKNRKLFDEATDRLLALADHELFHAYVQTEVYSQADGGLPAWLDEGLAQLVEHAVRRDDALGFSVRAPALKQRLRDALKQGDPPTAASLIESHDKHYLLADRRETDAVRRRYLFAWALAQLLVETKRLTPRDGLDRYVVDHLDDPSAAFARFTKKSPAEFEKEWREFLTKVVK